jgi:hypothetical protein
MVSSLLNVVLAAITVFTVIVMGYGGYWAFDIRRALRTPLYKNHALALAIVAVAFGVLDVENTLVDSSILVVPSEFLTLFATFIFMFYFIDSAMLSARRADPLLRDTARWTQIRKPLWIVMIATIAFAIGSSVAGYSGYGGVFLVPFILVLISGGVFLPRATRRSKDTIFNRHLKWFGIFVLLAIVWLIVGFFGTYQAMNTVTLLNSPLTTRDSYVVDFGDILGLTTAGYCLYKSAKSLVPLNRIETEVSTAQ